MPESHNAVLKDLVVDAEQAAVELDGRRILVRADPRSEAYAALRNLHENIEASVAARANEPAASGLFSRIGAFFRSLLGTGSDFGDQASPSAQRRPGFQAPLHSSNLGVRIQCGHAMEISLDSHGMHVRWSEHISAPTEETAPDRSLKLVDLMFALDSPVTEQLHRCFRELAKLGYAVPLIGAAIRAPALVAPPSTKQVAASTASGEKNTVTKFSGLAPSSAAVKKPGAAASGSPAADELSSREIIEPACGQDESSSAKKELQERKPVSKKLVMMRLRPELLDSPTRGMVASVEAPESADVLVAPELLLRALRASVALPSSSEQRLTFLQCMRNENGLRIVNVGFGSNGEGQPIVWQEATQWWQTHGRGLAIAAEASNQSVPEGRSVEIPERTYVCGQSPLGVSAGAEMEPAAPTV